MKDTIELTDPEDVAASRDWARRRGEAAAAAQRARARRATLQAVLGQDPAAATLAALKAAEEATARATDALGVAQSAHNDAQRAAALYEANELADAQQAADEATRALGAALSELLSEATTSAALTATVDGLALRARYQTATATAPPLWGVATIPFRAQAPDPPDDPQLLLPAEDEADYPRLLDVLQRLDDRVDAVADLITAEGVHHLVNGNPARSGAALDVAASGTVPDELDIIRTPRPGYDLTQRMLIVAAAGRPPAWTAPTPGVSAAAEPELAAWVSALLPDPARVELVATRVAPETDQGTDPLTLTADALGLDPLAWLRVAADRGELSARIARVARERWAATLGDTARSGRVAIADPSPRDPGRLALSDLLTAADAVRRLVASARALELGDLAAPTALVTPPADDAVTAVVTAVGHAEAAVAAIRDGLEDAATATDSDSVLDALLAASAVGVSEATPALEAEIPALATLQAQATAALARLTARTAGDAFAATPGDPEATLAAARERLTALCGSRQPGLVALATPSDATLRNDLGGGPVRLQGAAPDALRAWLHDHARVRPACAALQSAHELAEALGCPARLDLRATQLPAGAERWIEDDPAPAPSSTGIVVARGYAGDVPETITGLAVDVWTSTLPDPTHHTGLAFHYREADATPPQAILVAVAPDLRPDRASTTWDLDTLLDVVRSTFALAAERGAAPELHPDAAVTVRDEVTP
jgi:hypothetical protein